MATKKKLLEAAAGNAGGGGALNVEEVFSTYLYTGNGSTQTITNGIDLAGEGGLVWIKDRDQANNHVALDTERGANNYLYPNETTAEGSLSGINWSFNSDGFSQNNNYNTLNQSGIDYASWTFRKAPRFFDVVTYTGDGQTFRDLSHSLDGDIGTIIVKRTDTTGDWFVLSRNSDASSGVRFTKLNSTAAGSFDSSNHSVYWTNTTFRPALVDPAATNTNINGATYVAYLFAHNNGDGGFGSTADQDIIKCGSYTGTGTANTPEINLGWEPQFILIKNSSSSSDWYIVDNMRGASVGGDDAVLRPNLSNVEFNRDMIQLTPTGFTAGQTAGGVTDSGDTYIYIAIRRGPMAVPESATDVFVTRYRGEDTVSQPPMFYSGWPVDMAFQNNDITSSTSNHRFSTRLTGHHYLVSSSTAAEITGASSYTWDYMDGWVNATGTSTTYRSWMWRRAPNFFDVVAYTGNGTAGRTVSHNLGVAPEMMWVKRRNGAENWYVYHSGIGATKRLKLNLTDAEQTALFPFNNTAPTATEFTLANSVTGNGNGDTYIAYLFASLDGVSKVGSYTGNGTSQTIDCGFSSGARFVLIKGSSFAGDWWVFDTERGIVTGNDPRLYLNTTAAEFSFDYIDPYSSGFAVTDFLSSSGQTYIYYAIA